MADDIAPGVVALDGCLHAVPEVHFIHDSAGPARSGSNRIIKSISLDGDHPNKKNEI